MYRGPGEALSIVFFTPDLAFHLAAASLAVGATHMVFVEGQGGPGVLAMAWKGREGSSPGVEVGAFLAGAGEAGAVRVSCLLLKGIVSADGGQAIRYAEGMEIPSDDGPDLSRHLRAARLAVSLLAMRTGAIAANRLPFSVPDPEVLVSTVRTALSTAG